MAEQLELPGMPSPDFDSCGFSERDLARAQSDVAECDALLARYPDMMGFAYSTLCWRVSQAGHAGTRWLGEQVRAWLADEHDCGFTNGIVAVLMRRIVGEHPWVAGCVTLKTCAIDAILGGA